MKFLSIFFIAFIFYFSNIYSQVNVEDLRHESKNQGISFNLGLNFTIDKGNTEEVEIIPSAQLDYTHEKYYTFIYVDGKYKESDFSRTSNNAKIHYRFVYQLSEVFYPEVFLQSEFDEFIELKERDLIGGGMRFQIFNFGAKNDSTATIGLSFGVGAMYEYELINSNPDYSNYNTRLTSYLSFKWKPAESLICAVTTYFQPKLNVMEDIKVYNETELAFYINKYLAFNFDLTLKYHSRPPASVKTYDLEISNGLKLFL